MHAGLSIAPRVFRYAKMLFVAILLLGPLSASVAVTFDASSSSSAPSGTSSFTFNHVLGSGGNRLLVCTVALSTPTSTITQFYPTVTFGNVPMTPIAQSPGSSQNNPRVEGIIYWGER